MADNDNLAVKIVADASGVTPGVAQAKGEIGGLAPMLAQLNASMAQMTAGMKAGFAQVSAQIAGTAQEMRTLEEETGREQRSLKELVVGVHEGVESFNGFKAALSEIAEVWMAAFAIERIVDWAKEFAEAREHVAHLAETFGMTTAQVQGLGAVATASGISLDVITRGMQILDRNAIQAAEGTSSVATAFKAVGISANDGLSQMQRLETVADKFKDMEDGPKKAALAMELFGRSGAQLIPILNLGSDGLKKMADKAREFDVANTAVSDSAQEKGVALAEAINESKLAFEGMANVLGDAFAPILLEITDSINTLVKAFIDSYNEGGIVAIVFEVIGQTVEVAGAIINALAGIFAELWSVVSDVIGALAGAIADVFGIKLPTHMKDSEAALNVFKDTMIVVKDVVVAAIEVIKGAFVFLIDELRLFATQARDALTLNWGQMDADWAAGTDRIARHVEDASRRIQSAMSEAGAAIQAAIKGEALTTKPEGLKTSKGGAGTFDPDLGKTPKEKKDGSQMGKWEEELAEQKEAFQAQQDAAGTFHKWGDAENEKFWGAILAAQTMSAKDRLGVETKYYDAKSAVDEKAFTDSIAKLQKELDAAKGDGAKRLQIAEEIAAKVGAAYGMESAKAQAAQEQVTRVRRQNAAEAEALNTEIADSAEKLAKSQIASAQATAKFKQQMGLATAEQTNATERDLENQLYAIDAQAMEKRRQLMAADPFHDPLAYQKLCDQIEQADQEHQDRLTRNSQEGALQQRQIAMQTAQMFSGDITKMLTAQEGFAQGFQHMWISMGNMVSTAIQHMVENFLAGLIAQDTAAAASHARAMLIHAKEAAAGAFKAVVGIPVVGPFLAPPAAAAAFAGVMAFSAEGGWGEVPFDGAQTTLHKQEMVLPANLATPFRTMLQSSGSGGAGFGRGDVNLHYNPTVNGQMPFEEQLSAHERHVLTMVKGFVRDGRLK